MGVSFCRQLPTNKLTNMAESNTLTVCNCATKPTSSSSVCLNCQPAPNQSSQSGDTAVCEGAVPRDSMQLRRTFRNLSLGCRKSTKSKEKADKPGKSKLSWTLRWRLKSPQISVPREPMIDLARFNPSEYPIEDKDEVARRARAREIAEGIEMEMESLPPCYRLQNDEAEVDLAKPQIEPVLSNEPSISESQSDQLATVQPSLSASLIEGLTVLLHRSLAISMDSQRAWNVLTHQDLHFLVQHFHWHHHQHGPQVN